MRVCPKQKWTQIDIQILQSLFLHSDRTTIQHAFPSRTWKSIELKAWRLGLKRSKLGSRNPMWKGDKATEISARQRAIRNIPVSKGYERHHIDGDPYNNNPENIQVLTRRQHMFLDGRLSKRDAKGRFRGGE